MKYYIDNVFSMLFYRIKHLKIRTDLDYIRHYLDEYTKCINFLENYCSSINSFAQSISLALLDILQKKGTIKRIDYGVNQYYSVEIIEKIMKYKNIEIEYIKLVNKLLGNSRVTEINHIIKAYYFESHKTEFLHVDLREKVNNEIVFDNIVVSFETGKIKTVIELLLELYNFIINEIQNDISMFSEKTIMHFIKVANKNDRKNILNLLRKKNKKWYLSFLRKIN